MLLLKQQIRSMQEIGKDLKKKQKTKDSNCSAGVRKQDMWHAFTKPSNSMTIPKKEQKTVFNFPHEKLSHETGH